MRLFSISADLLAARPEEVTDLRGMLIASTYPLYPSNQWLTTPFRDGARVFFSSGRAEGFYNATTAHLWEMGADEPAEDAAPSAGPQLLEFGLPYDLDFKKSRQPPVWISAIGERGLYPIAFDSAAAAASNPAGPGESYLYTPETAPEGRQYVGWPFTGAVREAMAATRPNPHMLFWILYWSLYLLCVVVAAFTWLYVDWSTDPKKTQLPANIGIPGLRHVLRHVLCEVDEGHHGGSAYDPQARFSDPRKNLYPPPSGAGAYLALINVVVLGFSSYVFWHFAAAMAPYFQGAWEGTWALGLIALPPSIVTGSLALALLEYVGKQFRRVPAVLGLWMFAPGALLKSLPFPASIKTTSRWKRRRDNNPPNAATIALTCRWLAEKQHQITLAKAACVQTGDTVNRAFRLSRLVVYIAVVAVSVYVWYKLALNPSGVNLPQSRLTFERMTNLPSGVSPIFPVLFLTVAIGGWIYAQLARRRLYRLSYLPSDSQATRDDNAATHFEKILINMRKARGEADRLLATSRVPLGDDNPFLICGIALLIVHLIVRTKFRGLPVSLEGFWFDHVFWLLFLLLFLSVIRRARHLRLLWRTIQRMLHLAVELPLSPAYDRIPTRFKGWFFGQEDFKVREQIILQQTAALRQRTTEELARVFEKLEVASPLFRCAGTTWKERLAILQHALEDSEGALDSTRAVYRFLNPIWASIPVEDIPALRRAARRKTLPPTGSSRGRSRPSYEKQSTTTKSSSCATGFEWPMTWSRFRSSAGSHPRSLSSCRACSFWSLAQSRCCSP